MVSGCRHRSAARQRLVSQKSRYPTGKPLYMESKRARTFDACQTNGRWISGSAIRPCAIDCTNRETLYVVSL